MKTWIVRWNRIGKRRQCFFLMLAGLVCADASARIRLYHFDHISDQEGLSGNTVSCILHDRRGFIWFATDNGLNRYDGYRITVYVNNPYDDRTISSDEITALHEDKSGRIWVGTRMGLNRFDRERESFIRFLPGEQDSLGISGSDIVAIAEDTSGRLWIGTRHDGLNGLDPKTGRFVRYLHDPDNPGSVNSNQIDGLLVDRNGRLWVATKAGGLHLYDPEKDAFIRLLEDRIPPEPNHLFWKKLIQDRTGNLWIGSPLHGLYRYNHTANTLIHYRQSRGGLNSDAVLDVCETRNGMIWIGTDGGGLNLFDPKDETFSYVTADDKDPYSLTRNAVYSVFEDRNGAVWAGVFQGGVNVFFPNKKKFERFTHNPDRPDGLTHDTVFSMFEDSRGYIWIGTDGGGLNRYHRRSGTFLHFRHDPQDPESIPGDVIAAIYEDRRGVLWIGTYQKGLIRHQDRIFHRYHHDPTDPDGLGSVHVWSLGEDRDENLWIGTLGGGLSKLDRDRKTIKRFRNDPENENSLSNDYVFVIRVDHAGNVWAGTANGLNRFDREQNRFVRFVFDSLDANSLSGNRIFCIHEDPEKRLWIGTSNGLNRLRDDGNTFDRFTTRDGLPDNTIRSMVSDDRGRLWIATYNGLSRFDPRRNTFRNYGVGDGLQSKIFSRNCALKSASGEICFGGIKGFNVFHPDSIRSNPHIPPVVITGLQIFNRPVPVGEIPGRRAVLSKAITEAEAVVLSWKDRAVSLEFAALDFTAPERNQYAFRLEGFDREWNFVGNRRFAYYTNLQPGRYVFRVMGSNNDGVWNEEGTALRITITPPFWKTTWFRITMAAWFALSVYGIIEYRIRGIKKQRKKLESQVAERTRDLRTANLELEIRKRHLEENAEALRRSNEELEQFAYVASHDLQEPLRMVSSYATLLERNLSETLDPESKEFFFFMSDGARRMHVLINDLLTYSRVTTQAGEFKTTRLDEPLDRALLNLKIVIRDRGARITRDPLPTVRADAVQMERLFQNLIANAIKYCGDTPEIHVAAEKAEHEWIISIRDNGIGIDPKYTDQIFGIFKRLHRRDEYSGTGIGLAVCKKIVERHGGRIWVESVPGTGSTFYFTLQNERGVS